ncbi:MAG: phosphatidylglycerophosphatase A [Polyangiaceae bacterium]|nr:phosphatidylglycerophosphatase A [Polyangiaceae bacterium]
MTSAHRTRSAWWLATWFGAGRSPVAPGTAGTLAAVPLALVLERLPLAAHVAVAAGVTAAGIWSAGVVAEESGEDDPGYVVIDEVAGVLVALLFVRRRSWRARATAIALFRVLDIAKPGPIAAAERLRPAGVGMMVDDLVAGLAAGVAARLLTRG